MDKQGQLTDVSVDYFLLVLSLHVHSTPGNRRNREEKRRKERGGGRKEESRNDGMKGGGSTIKSNYVFAHSLIACCHTPFNTINPHH